MSEPPKAPPRDRKKRSGIRYSQEQYQIPAPIQPRPHTAYLEHLRNERKSKRKGLIGRAKGLFAKKPQLPRDSFGYNAVYGTHDVGDRKGGMHSVVVQQSIHGPANWDQFYGTWFDVGTDHLKPVARGKPLTEGQISYLKSKGIKILGQLDNSGQVWKARFRYRYRGEREYQRSKVMAFKVISLRAFDKSKQMMISVNQSVSDMFNEIRVLMQLKHKNIVSIRRIIEIPDTQTGFPYSAIGLLMTYYDGSLQKLVEETGRLFEDECRIWFPQIAKGLEYLHNQNVVHMNIKPSKILFLLNTNSETMFKLSDFSRSMRFMEGMATTSSTKRDEKYMAPEVRGEGPPIESYETKPADIYSLCTTLVVSLIGVEMDPNVMLNDLRQREWMNIDYMVTPMSAELADLMIRISEVNPSDRITIEEVCSHRWVKG